MMLKKLVSTLIFFLTCYCCELSAQIITVNEKSTINITNKSSISFSGIELSPRSDYVVTGPKRFNFSTDPVLIRNSSSINRVYTISNGLDNFIGLVTFKYMQNELNGLKESDLSLELLDNNDNWISLSPTLDYVNNTIAYDFNNLVSFKSITAGSKTNKLSISTVDSSNIKIFPNPTTDYIFIYPAADYKSKLYDISGKLILESKSSQIDISILPVGSYFLQLKSENNKISKFNVIKK
tara:strand:- start:375 stop:1088 length:714 start_codon:yes stop_codon:yes gene_type:complete